MKQKKLVSACQVIIVIVTVRRLRSRYLFGCLYMQALKGECEEARIQCNHLSEEKRTLDTSMEKVFTIIFIISIYCGFVDLRCNTKLRKKIKRYWIEQRH